MRDSVREGSVGGQSEWAYGGASGRAALSVVFGRSRSRVAADFCGIRNSCATASRVGRASLGGNATCSCTTLMKIRNSAEFRRIPQNSAKIPPRADFNSAAGGFLRNSAIFRRAQFRKKSADFCEIPQYSDVHDSAEFRTIRAPMAGHGVFYTPGGGREK